MEQTAVDQLGEDLAASRLVAARHLTPERQRQYLLMALGGLVAIVLLVSLAGQRYTARYDGRIFRGITVAGVPVGGLTPDEAAVRVAEETAAWAAQPREFSARDGGMRWSIAPAEFGVQFDIAGAVDEALAYGRGGNPLGNFLAWFGALRPLGGHTVLLRATVDDARSDAILRDLALDVTSFPADAVFTIEQGGRLTIVADRDGLGIDPDASRAALLSDASRLGAQPVTVIVVPVSAAISRAMLEQVDAQAQAIASQPLVGQYDGHTWTLPAETLAGALGYRLEGGRLVVSLNQAKLRPYFDAIGGVVNRPGTNAKLVLDGSGKYVIAPGQAGFGLDEPATFALINATLQQGGHELALIIKTLPPAIVDADLVPAQARLNKILATPIRVTFAEYSRVFVRADIQPLLRVVEQPDQPEKVAIAVDQAGVRALTLVLANDINQGVREAQFRFVNRAVRDVNKSQDGREVQYAGTDKALRDAILGATGAMTPAVAVTKPKVASGDAASMATPDRLAIGRTLYTGVAERRHNVELAAERLNGTIVPPGKLFSFNEAVGEQSVANGYQEAYGIALVPGTGGKPGEVKTVSSVAGGICQVSTTLLQAVFRAGLPIQERNWHLFWVGYAASSTGFLGLDATVDDQSGLDFQFYNSTGGWMGIEAAADGEELDIALYGKNPGWRVEIDDPVITNVRTPDPKPAYEKTHDLIPGTKLMIEHATEGFDAAIRRRVYDKAGNLVVFNGPNGPVKMDFTFRSSYLASRDRWQVGVPDDEPLTGPVKLPGIDDGDDTDTGQ